LIIQKAIPLSRGNGNEKSTGVFGFVGGVFFNGVSSGE
jgi:hypothetical protein